MSEATTSSAMDEQRIARYSAVGLPIVTLVAAGAVGVFIGPATSILVVAAGVLLGVIAMLWGSLRVLSGDAPISPDLEALDSARRGDHPLSSRKKMLLRAMKDLERERDIGKLEDDDFEQLSSTYRAELKDVLKRIDESLEPYRAKAEALTRVHLKEAGLDATGSAPAKVTKAADATPSSNDLLDLQDRDDRKPCPSCHCLNERDAKFCKECATKLGSEATRSASSDERTSHPSEPLP